MATAEWGFLLDLRQMLIDQATSRGISSLPDRDRAWLLSTGWSPSETEALNVHSGVVLPQAVGVGAAAAAAAVSVGPAAAVSDFLILV